MTAGSENRLEAQQNNLWKHIKTSGVTVMPHLLNDDQLKYWKNNFYNAINDTDGNNQIRNSRGRLHSHQESRCAPYNSHLHRLASSLPELRSIVELYFQGYSIERYQLTQTQFLLAKPGSEHQIWHRDNVAPGLTLLVALDDIKSNGPTELLLGSHSNKHNGMSGDDEVLLGCLHAGDAILYDARVIHRGRGYDNESDADRPVLILRWDALSTPPPGAGLFQTNYVNFLGSFRIFVRKAKDLVQYYFN